MLSNSDYGKPRVVISNAYQFRHKYISTYVRFLVVICILPIIPPGNWRKNRKDLINGTAD